MLLAADISMTDRLYRTLLGGLILVFLYFDLPWGMVALVGLLLFEGITNLRLPRIVNFLLGVDESRLPSSPPNPRARLPIEAERMWRLVVGLMLLVSAVLFPEQLWFFPWFMGFAILGAGLSGVCPVLFAIRSLGFT
ncbi:MAG: DUF2892 domain-containing protein [Gammaproteobacteria bacterium]|nr:MAG: DUF2892 domain-containing protein [Gammaproteobacteria bacterium]